MNEGPRPLSADADSSLLVVVDVQEKFVPHIHEMERVVARCVRMVRAARVLDVPIVVTEQLPDKLGPTVAPLREALRNQPVYTKSRFSCWECVSRSLTEHNRPVRTLLLTGIEAHVCVLQTALAALEHGLAVHIVRDAVSSRSPVDAETALTRAQQAGAVLTTSEMSILELVADAATPQFKSILPLIR